MANETVRRNPWEITGGKFDKVVSDTREALKLRKMDFPIEKHPLKVNGFDVVIPDKVATVRMDTLTPLGIVGTGYEVRDYVESFADTTDTLRKEGNLEIESCGMFGNGEKGFIQMRFPDAITVDGTNGKDSIGKYFTVITSHDGSLPLHILETAIRIVCQNTFRAALGDKSVFNMSAKHTSSMDSRLKAIRAALAQSASAYSNLAANVNRLASKGMTEETVKDFLHRLFPDNAKSEKHTRTENIREEIKNLYVNGTGQDIDGVKGTMWALYNGVTEFVDYHRSTRGSNDTERSSNRLESLLIGSGADLKDKAMSLALEMV